MPWKIRQRTDEVPFPQFGYPDRPISEFSRDYVARVLISHHPQFGCIGIVNYTEECYETFDEAEERYSNLRERLMNREAGEQIKMIALMQRRKIARLKADGWVCIREMRTR